MKSDKSASMNTRKKHRFRISYLAALLSGVAAALPLFNGKLSVIEWFALVPLFYIAQTQKSAYRHGLAFGIGYYGSMYYWFTFLYPMDFAGFTPAVGAAVIALAWGGMTLMQSAGTAFVPFLYRRCCLFEGKIWRVLAPICCASLWTVFEWLQTQTWLGVPWGRLAITQYEALPAIQSASLFGSLFVSFLIALVNALFASALVALKGTGRLTKQALAAVIILFGNYAFGIAALELKKDEGEPVRVALIQGNIASGDKWKDGSLEKTAELYVSLSEQASEEYSPDIIVWPETVINTVLTSGGRYSEMISELAVSTGAVILTGAYDSELSEAGEKLVYNSVVTFLPDGTVSDTVYHKRHLVPFGEYLPMSELISVLVPALAEMNLFDSDLTPGDSAEIIKTDIGNIGALVCFDSIYETLALDSTRSGAELIALVTNDSWYRDSAAAYQHNAHAVLRAVENGRYIMRAANTGVSSVIAPTGEIKERLGALLTGYVKGEVYFSSHRTLYSYVGNVIVVMSMLMTAFCAAYKLVYVRKIKRSRTV